MTNLSEPRERGPRGGPPGVGEPCIGEPARERLRLWDVLGLLLLGAVLSGAGLWTPTVGGHDEARSALVARGMVDGGDWLSPHLPEAFRHDYPTCPVENGALAYWDKPPMYFWTEAAAMKALGPTMLAARLPSAIAYLAMIVTACAAGTHLWGRRAGLLAGVLLAASAEPIVLAHIARMDMMLAATTSFMLLAILRLWGGTRRPRAWAALLGAAAGLGLLTKGLVAVVLPGFAVVAAMVICWRGGLFLSLRPLVALGTCAAAAMPWFLYMHFRYPPGGALGGGYLHEFFIVQHFGRATSGTFGTGRGVPGYLLLVLLAGFLPWTIYLPATVRDLAARDWPLRRAEPRPVFLLAWILAPIVIFSFSRTQLEAYVGPSFVGLAILVGEYLSRRTREVPADRLFRLGQWCLAIAGLLLVPALVVAEAALRAWRGWHAAVAAALGVIVAAGAWSLRRAGSGAEIGDATAGIRDTTLFRRRNRVASPIPASLIPLPIGLTVCAVVVLAIFGFAADPLEVYQGRATQGGADILRRELRPGDDLVCFPMTPYALAWEMWPTHIEGTGSLDELASRLDHRGTADGSGRTFTMIGKGSLIPHIREHVHRPLRELWHRGDFTLLVAEGPAEASAR
jgi:4-amino-4-deoxy-L-arabinose transferase-like glycosyltransferase